MSGLISDLGGFGSIADLAGKIIDRVAPDPAAKAQMQLSLAQLAQTGELAQLTASTDLAKAQIGVDQAEATNSSLFVAGWRPFVGWACGAAFVYAFIVQPLLEFIARIFHYAGELPQVDTASMMPVLLTILGLGGLRTVEKVKAGQSTDDSGK